MSNRRRVLRRGPLNGEMAPTAGVEMYDEIAEDFMAHVFGFEPGKYLITDDQAFTISSALTTWSLPKSTVRFGRSMQLTSRISNREFSWRFSRDCANNGPNPERRRWYTD